jgi:hypothetical protein
MMQARRLTDTVPLLKDYVESGAEDLTKHLAQPPEYPQLRESPMYRYMHNVFSQMATHKGGAGDAIDQSIRSARAMLDSGGKAIALVSHVCGKLGTAYETAVLTMIATSMTRFSNAGLLVIAPARPVR